MSHTGDYGDDAYYNTESLPMILRDYWDMTEEEEQKLIMLNDGNEAEGMYPLTFDEIADIIIDSLLSDGYDLDQLEAQYEADK
jgi:hypothetical protein